ncbi:META domain-containing protein [Variovorax sp. M-6]|uniref:META domain-containing protein n=1 Tax=Variovorax sp. M-6 TaxID=3233041 RepID=UPI003F95D6CA
MKTGPMLMMMAAGVVAAGAAGAAEPLRGPASASQGAPAAIEGPTWRLTDVRGFDAAALPVGPRSVTARFKGGRVDGFSGCNRYFGSYTFKDGRLAIGPLAGSMMACDDASMAVEKAVTRALSGAFRPMLAGDRLSLLSEGGEAMLAFKAEPAPALAGLRSNITGFNNGRQAVVSPLLGTTLSLSFGEGIVKGFGGCNTFRASYTADGDRIAVGPVAATRRACPAEGVMQQEREFIAALKSTTTWTFSGAFLDMHRPDGERTLIGSREAD